MRRYEQKCNSTQNNRFFQGLLVNLRQVSAHTCYANSLPQYGFIRRICVVLFDFDAHKERNARSALKFNKAHPARCFCCIGISAGALLGLMIWSWHRQRAWRSLLATAKERWSAVACVCCGFGQLFYCLLIHWFKCARAPGSGSFCSFRGTIKNYMTDLAQRLKLLLVFLWSASNKDVKIYIRCLSNNNTHSVEWNYVTNWFLDGPMLLKFSKQMKN